MNTSAWMRANLTTQGYRLSDGERRALWLGLRFPTALCLALVVTGPALESALRAHKQASICGFGRGFGTRSRESRRTSCPSGPRRV